MLLSKRRNIMKSDSEVRQFNKTNYVYHERLKKSVTIFVAISIFLILYFGLPDAFPYEARIMTAIVSFGIVLWALEPIPLGLTALIILLLMLIFHVADMDIIFS